MKTLRTCGEIVVSTVILVAVTLGVAGYFLFVRPHGDPLVRADAIVVLGGDYDGRVEYGLSLARQGYANTVLLSDAYLPQSRDAFNKACAAGTAMITVVCFRPDPSTTRGEAMFTERMAKEHNWKRVIVVSWNFHLVRARYIFHQCFDGQVTMRPVPRSYDRSLIEWTFTYTYQYVGLVKALIIGC